MARGLDGLMMDGSGEVVEGPEFPGMFTCELEQELAMILVNDHTDEQKRRFKVANILVTHLSHEERMCALHLFYQAPVAPYPDGEKLCRLQRKVLKKLKSLPQAELESLWHLL